MRIAKLQTCLITGDPVELVERPADDVAAVDEQPVDDVSTIETPPDSPEVLAYDLAAHAVVATLLGKAVDSIELPLRHAAVEFKKTAESRGDEVDQRLIQMAGPAAMRHLGCGWWSENEGSLDFAPDDDHDTSGADSIVHEHWAAIEAVATKLLADGVVSDTFIQTACQLNGATLSAVEEEAPPHYRPSTNAYHRCNTCSFFDGMKCKPFNRDVAPTSVCDAWAATPATTGDSASKGFPPGPMPGNPSIDHPGGFRPAARAFTE